MDEKSYVSLEQRVCMVCGTKYDTGALLLDRRMRASMATHTSTGWGICAGCKRLQDEGFVALIELDPQKNGQWTPGTVLRLDDAHRTGTVMHVKREVFNQLFNITLDDNAPCVFADAEVIRDLRARTPEH